jgi:UDP-glucuronate 4-epimerase
MKAVVTGAAGFIGSHLTERLLNEGYEVVGVDCFDAFYDPGIKRRNIACAMENPGFRLVEADIRDQAAMEQAIGSDVDVIVHLAARAGVRPSIEQPALYADININGTVVLLEIARQQHIQKFVFASSSSVYGNNRKVPFS